MTYLITGATGEVGSRVVRQLLERGLRPRVLARSAEKARPLFGDRVDIYVGDLAAPASIRAAIQGTDTVYLVNVGPEIPQRDEAVAMISKESRVRKMVKLSSLDVEHGLAIGAWHEKGEAAIRQVGVPFTFVRPTGFMSNLLAWAHSIRTEGIVRSSTGDGRRPFIHSEDIASVCVASLLQDEYTEQALPSTGPSHSHSERRPTSSAKQLGSVSRIRQYRMKKRERGTPESAARRKRLKRMWHCGGDT